MKWRVGHLVWKTAKNKSELWLIISSQSRLWNGACGMSAVQIPAAWNHWKKIDAAGKLTVICFDQWPSVKMNHWSFSDGLQYHLLIFTLGRTWTPPRNTPAFQFEIHKHITLLTLHWNFKFTTWKRFRIFDSGNLTRRTTVLTSRWLMVFKTPKVQLLVCTYSIRLVDQLTL